MWSNTYTSLTKRLRLKGAMHNQRLTLAEMAAVYNKTPKTFKKHVIATGVPHELVGRSMIFDPARVKAFQESLAVRPKQNVVELRPKTHKQSIVKSRFAEALG